jgi:hypothetical protein
MAGWPKNRASRAFPFSRRRQSPAEWNTAQTGVGWSTSAQQWLGALEEGLFAPLQNSPFVVREVFPTATIARFRTSAHGTAIRALLDRLPGAKEERAAVNENVESGVRAVKVPGQPIFDRVEAQFESGPEDEVEHHHRSDGLSE